MTTETIHPVNLAQRMLLKATQKLNDIEGTPAAGGGLRYSFHEFKQELGDAYRALRQSDAGVIALTPGASIKQVELGDLIVVRRNRADRPEAWAVIDSFGNCLSTAGEMDDEPAPSARTTEWIQQHRFGTLGDALRAAQAYMAARPGEPAA